jgi:hypothetical protein
VLAHQPSATDLLFITLRKSEALFSPSNRYRDLALGPALFHWESQSTTTEPFVCLGFASYETHEGERPMAWLPAVHHQASRCRSATLAKA